jgi:hypothetical protein
VTLFTSNAIGRLGHVTMTCRSLTGQGAWSSGDVIQILQSDWAAKLEGPLLIPSSVLSETHNVHHRQPN